MRPTVLDASALLALLFGEPGMEEVRALFHKAADADKPLLMTAVNWAEVLNRVARRQGEAGLTTVRRLASHGPLDIVPVDAPLAELADAFAAALARSRKAGLVTANREFKAVERKIKITWIKHA